MRRSTIISIIALAIAAAGVVIALLAYYKRRECSLCDDLEDEMLGEMAIGDDEFDEDFIPEAADFITDASIERDFEEKE